MSTKIVKATYFLCHTKDRVRLCSWSSHAWPILDKLTDAELELSLKWRATEKPFIMLSKDIYGRVTGSNVQFAYREWSNLYLQLDINTLVGMFQFHKIGQYMGITLSDYYGGTIVLTTSSGHSIKLHESLIYSLNLEEYLLRETKTKEIETYRADYTLCRLDNKDYLCSLDPIYMTEMEWPINKKKLTTKEASKFAVLVVTEEPFIPMRDCNTFYRIVGDSVEFIHKQQYGFIMSIKIHALKTVMTLPIGISFIYKRGKLERFDGGYMTNWGDRKVNLCGYEITLSRSFAQQVLQKE